MQLSEQSRKKLYKYVKSNSVVFQRFCKLVDVADDKEAQNREILMNDLSNATYIEVCTKNHALIKDDFNDINSWSTSNDYLFLLETVGTVVCIPKNLVDSNNILK